MSTTKLWGHTLILNISFGRTSEYAPQSGKTAKKNFLTKTSAKLLQSPMPKYKLNEHRNKPREGNGNRNYNGT